MEGSNILTARLDDEMEKYQAEQNSIDGILKEKVNQIWTTLSFY